MSLGRSNVVDSGVELLGQVEGFGGMPLFFFFFLYHDILCAWGGSSSAAESSAPKSGGPVCYCRPFWGLTEQWTRLHRHEVKVRIRRGVERRP